MVQGEGREVLNEVNGVEEGEASTASVFQEAEQSCQSASQQEPKLYSQSASQPESSFRPVAQPAAEPDSQQEGEHIN